MVFNAHVDSDWAIGVGAEGGWGVVGDRQRGAETDIDKILADTGQLRQEKNILAPGITPPPYTKHVLIWSCCLYGGGEPWLNSERRRVAHLPFSYLVCYLSIVYSLFRCRTWRLFSSCYYFATAHLPHAPLLVCLQLPEHHSVPADCLLPIKEDDCCCWSPPLLL